MSINPGYKAKASPPNAWKIVFIIVSGLCISFTAYIITWRYLFGPFRTGENRPYALKQNGDTLFIPAQVVVKHDTLVVIRTEERRPVQDSIDRASGTFYIGGGRIISGGWTVVSGGITYPKPYKQRDTIYEHKIIYY